MKKVYSKKVGGEVFALAPEQLEVFRNAGYDNGASLQGKGYDFAVRRVTRFLTKHYRQHGREGYALVFDFSKYFDTAQHAPVFRAIEKSGIDDRLVALSEYFIKCFGDEGLGLGSQVSQIAAIALPNKIDHYIIKVQDGRAITVVRALDRLERELGDLFPVIFKSITCDNGSEFANWAGIERSVWKRKGQRTTVYFCHPYTACERGTNENINRMIRRHFPKGTDFGKVTAAEVKRVERWINTYPREILGFSSSADMFAEAFGRAS